MQNKDIIVDSLNKINNLIDLIQLRTSSYEDFDQMLMSQGGMMVLDAVCMNLITLGEAIKGLDKLTHGELFGKYPEVYWVGAMRMRDKIAHHYFEIDAEVVENTVRQDLPAMKEVVERMLGDISL